MERSRKIRGVVEDMETIKIDLTKKRKTKKIVSYLNVYEDGRIYGYSEEEVAAQVRPVRVPAQVFVALPIEITYEE